MIKKELFFRAKKDLINRDKCTLNERIGRRIEVDKLTKVIPFIMKDTIAYETYLEALWSYVCGNFHAAILCCGVCVEYMIKKVVNDWECSFEEAIDKAKGHIISSKGAKAAHELRKELRNLFVHLNVKKIEKSKFLKIKSIDKEILSSYGKLELPFLSEDKYSYGKRKCAREAIKMTAFILRDIIRREFKKAGKYKLFREFFYPHI